MNVQADAPFRVDADIVRQLKVRNADGDVVPLGAVAEVRESAGPVQITRYNMFPAAAINGASLPGVSAGDVLGTMEKLAAQDLPRNMISEWTELSYLQKQESKIESIRDLQQNPFSAFVLGTVLVFLVLAGLYESWSLPLAVILVVPMCLLSALAGTSSCRLALWCSSAWPPRTPSSSSSSPATGSTKARPCSTQPWRPPGCGCGRSS